MRTLRWSIASGLAVLLVAAGAACAHETGSGGPAPSASPAPPSASPAASKPAQPPQPPPSPQPPAARGMTVTMSASTYAVGDTLKLTVRNGRSDTAYTEDFQTLCSIVTLQKSGGGWTDITGCSMGRPTRTIKLAPGAAKVILLDPHAFHLAEGSGGLGFGAGTYRIRFGYRLGAEPMGAQPLTAYSPTFTVR